MTLDPAQVDIPPFHLQDVITDLYHAKDLLDLSSPAVAGPSTPPAGTSPAGIFSSAATSLAAVTGRRAAAAGSTTGSSPVRSSATRPSQSPIRGEGAEGTKVEVRCVEGYGQNLYIGRSDGVVEWWVIGGPVASTATDQGWALRHKHTVFPRRAISKIVLLPKVSKAFALSDGTLHALALPSLEPLPSTTIQSLRGIINVILDDDELDWGGPGTEEKGTEMTVVVVRRRGLGIYRVGSRMTPVKEIPLPSGPTHAALASNYLCAAIPSSNTYSLIDLSDASLTEVLPVSQIDPSELDFEPNPNVVVIPGENEFLVTSYTGAGAMGVFLNGQGDPVRGTMEWTDHPLSISIDSGFILALLRNQTVVIHSLNDLEKPVQAISLSPTLSAFHLCYSPYGIAIRNLVRDERMQTARLQLLGGKLAPAEPIPASKAAPPAPLEQQESQESLDLIQSPPDATSPAHEEPPGGSGLTPPSSPPPFRRQPIPPNRGSSLLQATAPTFRGPFSTAVAETLAIGPNGIQSVAPTPILLRLEHLCTERQVDEAVALVDEERRRGRRGEVDADKATHQGTLRLLHLYLACFLLQEGKFEKAGDYFMRAKADPRLIVRVFPTFRGKVIGSAEEIEVYQGVIKVLSEMPAIEEIISAAVQNGPNIDAEGLNTAANNMLTDVLRKTRTLRRKGGGARGADSWKIDIVIDTTLAKLLAELGTTDELLALLTGPNDCVLGELEPFLEKRPYVLAMVMKQQGRTERVLELLQSIAESPAPDPLCPDPAGELAQTLQEIKDPQILRRYILWLASRLPDKALSVIYAQNTKSGVKFDDAVLFEDLRAINPDMAYRFLEHIVVGKRSPAKALHQELLSRLLDVAEEQVKDDGVKYHLEELDAEYRLQRDPQPFCVFLAEVAPNTPIKSVRLKLLLFLQGSPFYDLTNAAERLSKMEGLKPEVAVVLGRLGRNREALQLLARDIGDFVSAQTYCTQGGEIIPPRVARSVALHVPEMAEWATLGEVGRRRRGTVDAKTQEKLVMELLGVYMRDGASTARQTAALLNAQSVHLDVLEVLALVPPEWPLDVVSSFFQRSLRRQLHDKASGQILKAIAAGQNLETSEAYLDAISHIPPKIIPKPPPGVPHAQDGVSPGESVSMLYQPSEGSIPEKEYTSFDEKRGSPVAEKIGSNDLDGGNENRNGENGEKEEKGYIVEEVDTSKEGRDGRDGRDFFGAQGVDKELTAIASAGRGGGVDPLSDDGEGLR